MTADAVRIRCSQVYDYAINVSHSCESSTSDDGETFMSCTVSSELEWRHWTAGVWNGMIMYSLDDTWQDHGAHLIQVEGSGRVEVTGDVTAAIARGSALRIASHNSGANLMREMLDVPEFRVRAPLVRVDGRSAYTCLPDDQVYLDMPFLVTMPTVDGSFDVGFIKVREMFQGCDDTPALAERRADGEEIILEPTRHQIIISRIAGLRFDFPKVMQGMTAEQLPSRGVSVGVTAGGGAWGSIVGADQVMGHARIGIAIETSLARRLNISELYAVSEVSLIIQGDFEGGGNERTLPIIGQQLLKRAYLGRFFLDGAVGVSAAFSDFSNDKTPDIFGVVAELGLGFQASPRILYRIMDVDVRAMVGEFTGIGLEFGMRYTYLL
jgi:hypothetical protein